MERKRPRSQIIALKDAYDRYSRSLCHQADSIIHDWQQATSIVNDVYLYFDKKELDWLSPDVQRLLYIATVRKCLDHLRKKKSTDKKRRRWILESVESPEDPLFTNDKIKAELINKIFKAMGALPPAQHKAVEGYFLSDISTEDLAAELGITVSTLHGNKDKGLAGMAKHLGVIIKKKLDGK